MKLSAPLALILTALFASGCSDPKKTVISSDPASWERELKPSIERLSEEDRKTLAAYLFRAKMGEAFGGQSRLGTITVGEALEEQKKWEMAKKAEAEEKERLAQELKAKRETLAQQVRETLDVVLVDKGFHKADYMNNGDFQDKVTFTLGLRNRGQKEISGFKGKLLFKDMFGDAIKNLSISYDQAIPAGQTVSWQGGMDFNPFIERDAKLRDTEPSKITLEFEPEAILFADGTKLELPASDTPPAE